MRALSNIKVIELAGLAPIPLCGMILSDYGAKVIRVDSPKGFITDDILNRGKQSIVLNLKRQNELNICRRLIKTADILLDPYRPGVLERLSLVPAELRQDNPKLIIVRLSGYGQIQPNDRAEVVKLKNSPGHDINYLAMSGVLSRLGTKDLPQPPVNMLADFGAGAMSCVNGILAALVSRGYTGQGQVIDCSITLSSAYICSFLWRSRDKMPFLWPNNKYRSSNILDGGAPFYRCYQTSDGRFMAVGALEPQFYRALLHLLSVPEDEACQHDVSSWPKTSERFENIFKSRTEQQWIDAINAVDECCVTPVLELDEASRYWREYFLNVDGHSEPGPNPRLQNSEQPSIKRPRIGEDTEAVLRDIGCTEDEIRLIIEPVSVKL